ncbi:hypothetical protein [Viridibacillus arvi]|uniref:hypothetical protein n=1 Tax=Viridibacillus arvi TaxID=263475 RepID=UPI003D29ECEE
MEIQCDYKAAERTLFNTISLANEVEDNQVITNCYNNICSLCIKEGKINEAYIFGKKGLEFAGKMQNDNFTPKFTIYIKLVEILLLMNEVEEASIILESLAKGQKVEYTIKQKIQLNIIV